MRLGERGAVTWQQSPRVADDGGGGGGGGEEEEEEEGRKEVL